MIVWLASYPRSGNTYCRVLLNSAFGLDTYSIHNDLNDIAADSTLSEMVGRQNLSKDFSIENARQDSELYVIKTHGLPSVEMVDDKIIYLARDGRESLVSYFNYINDFSEIECTVEDIIIGKTFFGRWEQHFSEWKPKESSNTLFLQFEEVVVEPEKCVQRIGEFLNIEPLGKGLPGFEQLNAINPKFFRKGAINSWSKILTKTQVQAFEFLNWKALDEIGYQISSDPELEDALELFKAALDHDKTVLLSKKDNEIYEIETIKEKVLKDAGLLENEVNDLKAINQNLQSEVSTSKNITESLQQKISDLNSKNESHQQQIADLNNIKESLQKTLSDLSNRIEVVEMNNANLRSEVDSTNDQLKQSCSQLESANIRLEEMESIRERNSLWVAGLNKHFSELTSCRALLRPFKKRRYYKNLLNYISNKNNSCL